MESESSKMVGQSDLDVVADGSDGQPGQGAQLLDGIGRFGHDVCLRRAFYY